MTRSQIEARFRVNIERLEDHLESELWDAFEKAVDLSPYPDRICDVFPVAMEWADGGSVDVAIGVLHSPTGEAADDLED